MKQITNITSSPKQLTRIILDNGSFFDLQIEYKPQQYGWFITTLSYNDKTINGMRITTGLNLLYQYKGQLPFGLCVTTEGSREPYLIDDFESGRSKLYVMTEAEVQTLEDYYSGQI